MSNGTIAQLREGDSRVVYAELRKCASAKTRDGKEFLVLELCDNSGVIEGKVWGDRAEAMQAAKAITLHRPVKVMGKVTTYQGRLQLIVEKIREVLDPAAEPGFDPATLLDPDLVDVEDLVCGTLVFDIETVPGVDRRELTATVAEALGKWAEKREMEPGSAMGLSPWFGKIVSLAFAEGETECRTEDVTVLFVPKEEGELANCPPWMRPMSEAQLLRTFWSLASRANTVVTFNGKNFDIPFLVTRSLIHGIPARVDLTKAFALQPHLDLYEVVAKTTGGPGKLDVVCWALGVESPKGAMDGSMVAPAYDRGDYERIAEYNAHDVRATAEVYRKVRDHILKFRSDWTQRG
ncbi:MAG: hypothetical protein RIT25_1858 [Planctomycetota bacterium]